MFALSTKQLGNEKFFQELFWFDFLLKKYFRKVLANKY